MASRLDITDMQAIALMMGGKCLSKEYWNDSSPLSWHCENGHNWDAPYTLIQQGAWCPQCAHEEQKQIYLERCQELALTKGGLCLSTVYASNKSKLKWQCTNGHQWMATPASIRKGIWCKQCKRREFFGLRLKEFKAIAKGKGGVCLSETFRGIKIKLEWQCKEGHQWQTTPANIAAGNWCPYCAGVVKHTLDELQKKAAEHGGKCLSTEYKNVKLKIRWQCDKGHIWMADGGSVLSGKWCQKCYWLRSGDRTRGNLDEFIKIADSHGGKLLSKKYVDSNEKLRWQCDKGHIWYATGANVKHSKSWCRRCIKRKLGYTIEDMKRMAHKHRGECLSEKYSGNAVKLKWECKNGHQWMAKPMSIIRGSWCRLCYHKYGKGKILTPDKVRELKEILLNPDRKIPLRSIAEQFGIAYNTAINIKRGQTWKNIKPIVPGSARLTTGLPKGNTATVVKGA